MKARVALPWALWALSVLLLGPWGLRAQETDETGPKEQVKREDAVARGYKRLRKTESFGGIARVTIAPNDDTATQTILFGEFKDGSVAVFVGERETDKDSLVVVDSGNFTLLEEVMKRANQRLDYQQRLRQR